MGPQWSSQPDCPELLPALDSSFLSSFGKCISGSFYILWLVQQEGNLSQVTADLGAA